jgi:hypothetical protein
VRERQLATRFDVAQILVDEVEDVGSAGIVACFHRRRL